MGSPRSFFHHAGYPVKCGIVIHGNGLSDGVPFRKVLKRLRLGKNNGIGLIQAGVGVPLQQTDAEHIKKSRIGIQQLVLQVFVGRIDPHQPVIGPVEAAEILHFRDFLMKRHGNNGTDPGPGKLLPGHFPFQVEPVDVRGAFIKAVVTGFTDDIEDYEDGTGQTDGQSRDIDGIECFVLANAPDSDPKEVSPHWF